METKALREYVGRFCALRSSDLAGGLALVAALRESVYCIEELQHELTAQEKRIAALEAASQPAPVAPIAEGEAEIIAANIVEGEERSYLDMGMLTVLANRIWEGPRRVRIVVYPAE